MAATNQYMEAAANTIFELSSDENIRELCRRRAEFEAYERYQIAEIKKLKRSNADLMRFIKRYPDIKICIFQGKLPHPRLFLRSSCHKTCFSVWQIHTDSLQEPS